MLWLSSIFVLIFYHLPEALLAVTLGLVLTKRILPKNRFWAATGCFAIGIWVIQMLMPPTPARVAISLPWVFASTLFAGGAPLFTAIVTTTVVIIGESLGEMLVFPICNSLGITAKESLQPVYHIILGLIALTPEAATLAILRRQKLKLSIMKAIASPHVSADALRSISLSLILILALIIAGGKALALVSGDDPTLNVLTASLDVISLVIALFATLLCYTAFTLIARESEEKLSIERQLSAKLRQSLKELDEAQAQIIESEKYKVLGEMAGGMAHSFNNILTTIKAWTQILQLNQSQNLDESQLKAIQRVISGVNAAADLVNRIRNLNVADTEPANDLVDLSSVADESARACKSRYTGVDISFSAHGPCYIKGSRAQLVDALMNLLNNACDAVTAEGRVDDRADGEVHLTLRELDAACEVEIRDNGIGMSEETLTKVFMPFFSTKGSGGMGLGLAIVRTTIIRHAGTIDVTSRPGEGTTFILRFPKAKAQVATAPLPATPASKMANTRVLIIDDNLEAAQGIAEYLRLKGCTTTVLTKEEELVGLAAREVCADIILTDLSMPGIGGLEVARHFSNQSIPVIVITGWGDEVHAESMAQHGITALIRKPVDLQDLEQKINELVS